MTSTPNVEAVGANAAAQARAAAPTSHPIAFWFFFWGEFAERCSFYGMKAVLFKYMTDRLLFGEGTASGTINYFKAACYFLPLAGGFLADHYLGKYRTIVVFSIPYILGHVILGFESVPCLLIALALLAMGAGAVKPNLSPLMGMTYDQQRPGQAQLRSDAFSMFYVAINTGAFASSSAVPLIRTAYGYRMAFLFPAACMVVAFLLFVAGKPFYAKEEIPRARPARQQRGPDWPALWKVIPLFVVIIFFWSVLEQYDNTWILFTKDHISLNVFEFGEGTWQAAMVAYFRDRWHIRLLGQPLEADQFQVLNPIFVMVLVPIAAVVWRLLAWAGWRLRPTDKMFIGFLLTLATPSILAAAGALAGEAGRVSAWWLVAAYFVVTLGEVCISVTGLELAFTAAPESMKGAITALWLMTMSFGDILNGLITPYYKKTIALGGLSIHLTPAVYFGLFALATVPVIFAFLFVARRFNDAATPAPEAEILLDH